MNTATIDTPALLIGDYSSPKKFKNLILNNIPIDIPGANPAFRYRGTIIRKKKGPRQKVEIIAWQKNVAKIINKIVFLPTIITFHLDKSNNIKNPELMEGFRGSKGVFCSWDYLNNISLKKLKDININQSFSKKIKVSEMHCFHITEVLGAFYSFFQIMNELRAIDKEEYFLYEEEVLRFIRNEDDHIGNGIFLYAPGQQLEYTVIFKDIYKIIEYDDHGRMKINGSVPAVFYLNGEKILEEKICQKGSGKDGIDLINFLFTCVNELKPFISFGQSKILNTNLYPSSFYGLLGQYIGLETFKDDPIMSFKALTMIQRPGETAACIGSVINEEEAASHFPLYDYKGCKAIFDEMQADVN